MLTIITKKVFAYGGREFETAGACLKAVIKDHTGDSDELFLEKVASFAAELLVASCDTGCGLPCPDVDAPVAKKRGRQPGYKKPVAEVEIEAPVAKKRGRQPGYKKPVAEVEAPVAKKRGRPPGYKKPVAEVTSNVPPLPPVTPPSVVPPLPPGIGA